MRTIKNLIGAILISIAVFLVWILILPDYNNRAYLQSTIQTRSADFDSKDRLVSKTLDLDKQYQSRYAELKRLSLVIPAEKHIDEMITIFQDIFSTTGVPLKDMQLSAVEGDSALPYNLVSMQFTFDATYDSIINFLNAIEKSIRLIDTTSISVGINSASIVNKGPLTLTVLYKAQAYFLKKEVPTKAAVPTPAASATE